VLVSKKNGEDLEIRVPPDHPLIGEFLRFFKHLVGREFAPVRHVRVAVINGRSALESPCAKALIEIGFHRDHNSLALRRRY
jgi:hypothetical protein